MSHFGTTKNPPWARPEFIAVTATNSLNSLSQPMVTNALINQSNAAAVPKATVYSITTSTSQPNLQQQYAPQQLAAVGMQAQHRKLTFNFSEIFPHTPNHSMINGTVTEPPPLQPGQVLSQPGLAISTSLASTTQVASVSYPPPVASNRVSPAQQSLKQRFFTGTVTKIMDNFGFVDEDVFFQMNCCKGPLPKLTDRVLVEASYNANMPFKWNATRIQVLPNQNVACNQMNQMNQVNQVNQVANSQTLVMSNPTIVGSNPMAVAGTVVTPTMAHTPVMAPSIAPPVTPNITPSIPAPVAAPPPVQPPVINQQPPPLMAQIRQPGPAQPQPPPLIQQGAPVRMPMPSRRNTMGMRFDRDREREQRDKEREMRERERREQRRDKLSNKRPRSPSNHRSHSPVQRARSPKRRRGNPRVVPRYVVQIPKLSLETNEANVIILKSRYSNLYIPSDFFQANFTWTSAFPLYRPFQLGTDCTFHVMPKDTEPITLNVAESNMPTSEPTDADHLYSAKVMLLSSPKIEEIYQKCCGLGEDVSDGFRGEQTTYQHPTRMIQFLVGLKGKNEPMAIGGPWSPSLDGPNPGEDPKVLINTAIRNTKALTNIDLSMCTQWYRFAEIRYVRPEEMHKGRLVPARVETVVLFLPDVWSIRPTCLEWDALRGAYKTHLQKRLAGSSNSSGSGGGGTGGSSGGGGAGNDRKDDPTTQEEENANPEKEPTHFSELDPKTMKIVDLRRELEDRNLSSKGLKSQLIARLTKVLKTEKEEEEEQENNKVAALEEAVKKQEELQKMEVDDKDDKKKKEEEEKKRKEEKELAVMERKYTLPDKPSIIVHPSPTAKGGKFDCTVMSLSVLLDYRQEDNKEHSFEVSLFAELFNEMLMRDFGFKIYKVLALAPEKKDDEKLKDKKKSDEKSSKDEKSSSKDDNRSPRDDRSPKDKDRKFDDDKFDKKREDDSGKEMNGNDEDLDDDDDDDDPEDDDKDDRKDKVKKERDDKKKDKRKYHTTDPSLLLSFVYFDQNHTGYLLDKDIEEIIHTTGMQLSRAQVRKFVQKLVTRDALNYRKLTDRPKSEDSSEDSKTEVRSTEADDMKLAQGNYLYLNALKHKHASDDFSKTLKKDKEHAPNSGLISYNGALIDIDSITQRLEKSEKNRSALEEKLQDFTNEVDLLKEQVLKGEEMSKKLQMELSLMKKEREEHIETANTSYNENKRLYNTLKQCEKTLTGLLKGVATGLSTTLPDKKKKIDKKVKNENDTGE